MNDLPPSLREEEKSGTEASPTQDPQAGSADVEQSDRQKMGDDERRGWSPTMVFPEFATPADSASHAAEASIKIRLAGIGEREVIS